ncbi:2-dehydropantoate 2-reductase [Beijerinckia sp. L45]|uniref:2-dehydropantoate 2-reductase n=1 Tax=Beijerinckia sp. L45 TaxID=1641855 RepID=UPI00131E5438|nr:2-dehydropantoate 2-reductase [Beijerinckia sp. L45]
MRILILGAGATGGYFGGRLAQSGADVTFLLRPARAARIAAEGLRIRSPEGDFQGPVATVTAEALTAPYDLVVLSCKAYDLDQAMDAIKPAVGPSTAILPLLNGLNHFERLDAAFGAGQILGGLCHIGATMEPDGTIVHFNRLHSLTFGERAGGVSPRIDAIAAIMAKANFASRLSSDVLQDLWEKFAFLSALAGATCLMRASVGAIVSTRDGDAIIRELFLECQAVAAAAGKPVRPKAIDSGLTYLTAPGSNSTASMMRDIEGKQRIEADHVIGDLLRRAEAAGLKTPLLRVAFCHLQSYEARQAAGQ